MTTTTTTNTTIEQEIQAKGLTALRITPADIEANIASEFYFTGEDGVVGHHVKMTNWMRSASCGKAEPAALRRIKAPMRRCAASTSHWRGTGHQPAGFVIVLGTSPGEPTATAAQS